MFSMPPVDLNPILFKLKHVMNNPLLRLIKEIGNWSWNLLWRLKFIEFHGPLSQGLPYVSVSYNDESQPSGNLWNLTPTMVTLALVTLVPIRIANDPF